MKHTILTLFIALTSFFSQAQKDTILYSEYHEQVEGNINVILINSIQIKCGDTSFIRILPETGDVQLNVMVAGMSIRVTDESEHLYAIYPDCSEGAKNLMISYRNEDNQMMLLTRIKLDIVDPGKEEQMNVPAPQLSVLKTGTYEMKRDDGTYILEITKLTENTCKFKFEIATKNTCFGNLKGKVEVDEKGQGTFTAKNCEAIHFHFTKEGLGVEEENCTQYHGVRCSFDGIYTLQ